MPLPAAKFVCSIALQLVFFFVGAFLSEFLFIYFLFSRVFIQKSVYDSHLQNSGLCYQFVNKQADSKALAQA
jgi:hypothetical protein